MAGARFHRPPSGIGLGERAQAHIKAMRMLCERPDIFSCEPHNDLLKQRSKNEAYCTANPGVEYAVFFCDGGDVYLDVSAAQVQSRRPALAVHWLDIMAGRWLPLEHLPADTGQVRLTTPRDAGFWAAWVTVE